MIIFVFCEMEAVILEDSLKLTRGNLHLARGDYHNEIL